MNKQITVFVPALILLMPTIAAADDVSFLSDVAPILLQRCSGCHGPKKSEGDYRLHTFNYLAKPGASEESPLVPERPNDSEIFRRITETDPDLRMPQADDPLDLEQIEIISRWIAAGAASSSAPRVAQRRPSDWPSWKARPA